MSLARFSKRRDAAESGIVEALEAIGALVYRVDVPCDLFVYFRERWYPLEVKAKKRNDQPKQDEFRALTNTPVVATITEALIAVGATKL